LYFKNCVDGEYTIPHRSTKIYIEGCSNCTFNIDGAVLTNVLEMWKGDNNHLRMGTLLKTLQLDMMKKIRLTFHKKDHFHGGAVVWNQVEECALHFNDAHKHNLVTGFEHMKKLLPDSNAVIDQFIVRFLHQDGVEKLVPERCVRLKNGFLSTEREADDWEQRNVVAREKYVDNFLKKSGLNLGKSEKQRRLPNAPCDCGSGKKYKKCCGLKKNRVGVDEVDRKSKAATESASAAAAAEAKNDDADEAEEEEAAEDGDAEEEEEAEV